jgi:processive 1,2-diacylglycerol beta-glucosyltransferase
LAFDCDKVSKEVWQVAEGGSAPRRRRVPKKEYPEDWPGTVDVLVLTAKYGDGHLSAARAIKTAVGSILPDAQVELLDYYGFVSPRLDRAIRWSYLTSVRRAPWAYRWFYESTQHIDPNSSTQSMLNRIGLREFYRAVAPHPPRVIVSTYPTAAGVVATLKHRGLLDVDNFVVMTDYAVHSQWLHRGVDRYFVGAHDMRDAMVRRGFDPDAIDVCGIPVDARFRAPGRPREEMLKELGLPDQRTILYMGGSYLAMAQFREVLGALAAIDGPVNLVVVGGRAASRTEEAARFRARSPHPTVALGFVDNVSDLMSMSDILVTKAGGLTTTEALCRGLPMVVYRQIPGQEDSNAAFLARHGAAIITRTPAELRTALTRLLTDDAALSQMARAAATLGLPDGGARVAERVRDVLERRRVHAGA